MAGRWSLLCDVENEQMIASINRKKKRILFRRCVAVCEAKEFQVMKCFFAVV